MPFIQTVKIVGGGPIDLGPYDANNNDIIDDAENLTNGVDSVGVGDIIDMGDDIANLENTKLDKDGNIDGGGFVAP